MTKLEEKIVEASIDYQIEKSPMPIECSDEAYEIVRALNVNDDFIAGGQWLYEHQWIALKEEKPVKGEPILMFSKPIGAVMLGVYNGRFFFNSYNKKVTERVTHWMRIPRPPMKELDSAE